MYQVYAFVAPKIIGGVNAPSPVGELGMVEMSQALDLIDVSYEQVSSWVVVHVIWNAFSFVCVIYLFLIYLKRPSIAWTTSDWQGKLISIVLKGLFGVLHTLI